MSIWEDRVKRALANKPTHISQVKQPKGRKEVRQSLKRPRPQPPIPVGGMPARYEEPETKDLKAPKVEPIKMVSKNTLFVTGQLIGYSGYDNIFYEITNGLLSLGLDVRISTATLFTQQVAPPHWSKLIAMKPPENWDIIILPPPSVEGYHLHKKSIIFTMWETDHVEPQWTNALNKSAFIINCSQWGIDTFKASGVNVPMYKIPLGHNPLYFNPEGSFPNECVFGVAAALNSGGIRKNVGATIEAFSKAFSNGEKVRLKIKLTPHCNLPLVNDKRIEIIKAYLSPLELAHWYRSLTALVNTSYCEGFGLHLLEAMACERCLISTKYSAVAEYFDENVGYVIDHKIVPANGKGIVPYTGHWAEPSVDSLVEKMSEVYNDKEKVKFLGEQAGIRASELSWRKTGQRLVDLLREKQVI